MHCVCELQDAQQKMSLSDACTKPSSATATLPVRCTASASCRTHSKKCPCRTLARNQVQRPQRSPSDALCLRAAGRTAKNVPVGRLHETKFSDRNAPRQMHCVCELQDAQQKMSLSDACTKPS